jgi:hypothetical protein
MHAGNGMVIVTYDTEDGCEEATTTTTTVVPAPPLTVEPQSIAVTPTFTG